MRKGYKIPTQRQVSPGTSDKDVPGLHIGAASGVLFHDIFMGCPATCFSPDGRPFAACRSSGSSSRVHVLTEQRLQMNAASLTTGLRARGESTLDDPVSH